MSDKNGSEGRIQWSRFFKKLSPYMIQKGLLYLKHYGPREFWIRLHERFEPEEILMVPGTRHMCRTRRSLTNKERKNLLTHLLSAW